MLSSWSLLHCFWDPIYNAVAKIGTIELRVSNSDGKIYPNLHFCHADCICVCVCVYVVSRVLCFRWLCEAHKQTLSSLNTMPTNFFNIVVRILRIVIQIAQFDTTCIMWWIVDDFESCDTWIRRYNSVSPTQITWFINLLFYTILSPSLIKEFEKYDKLKLLNWKELKEHCCMHSIWLF